MIKEEKHLEKLYGNVNIQIVGVGGRSLNLNLVYELNNNRPEFTSLILYFLGIPLWSYIHARKTVNYTILFHTLSGIQLTLVQSVRNT
jgi:hypothetical protein